MSWSLRRVFVVLTTIAILGSAACLQTAFAQKQQLTTDILLSEISATQPLSVTRAEDIQAIRDWAKTRAVPAD